MSDFSGGIYNFTNNSYLKLRYTITSVTSPIDSAAFTIKLVETDSVAVLQKTISATNSPGVGQIENDGSSGTGIIRFDLPPADTVLLTPGVKYTYWCDITLDTGEVTCIEKGKISPIQGSSHS